MYDTSWKRADVSEEEVLLATWFQNGIIFQILDPEDEGDMYLRNLGWISTDYMALYPTR
jgi:hypothetical protein